MGIMVATYLNTQGYEAKTKNLWQKKGNYCTCLIKCKGQLVAYYNDHSDFTKKLFISNQRNKDSHLAIIIKHFLILPYYFLTAVLWVGQGIGYESLPFYWRGESYRGCLTQRPRLTHTRTSIGTWVFWRPVSCSFLLCNAASPYIKELIVVFYPLSYLQKLIALRCLERVNLSRTSVLSPNAPHPVGIVPWLSVCGKLLPRGLNIQ